MSSPSRATVEFMAHHHLRSLHSCYHLRIKSFLARHLLPHVAHALRTAKAIAADLLRNRPRSSGATDLYRVRRRRRRNKKVHPPDINPLEVFDVTHCLYFDSTWNSIISAEDIEATPPPAGAAACEEKNPSATEDEEFGNGGAGNEIDRLAEKFIASCHERFRLEKQESYRRYLEMLARSV